MNNDKANGIEVAIITPDNTIQVSGLNSNEREALAKRIRKVRRGCESQLIMEYAANGMLNIKTGLGMRREARVLTMKELATFVQEQVEASVWR